jgi:predicted aminopeptidase
MHSNRSRRVAAGIFPLLLAVMLLGGCQSLAYYAHLTRGQIAVLAERTPVPRVMDELERRAHDDPRALERRHRLAFTQRVLAVAERELGLNAGRRYRTFVDLDRTAVVWNVFAAPALSLTPHQWCYPLVGCAPYRGYFDRRLAERHAAWLAGQGFDVHVGPVTAYSTLGWFADPLLSTFIDLPEAALAELLLHELAHGEVWAPGDVAFNESFATFVGRQGVAVLGLDPVEEDAERRHLLRLLGQTREALLRIYAEPGSERRQHARKAAALDAARRCHDAHAALLGRGRYADLLWRLNNARLAAVSTYEDLVPAFAAWFEEVGGDWPAFFAAVRQIAALDADQRLARLRRSGEQQIAAGGDDDGAEEIQCQPFFRHLFDGEPAGGVDDHVRGGRHRQHEGA